MISGFVTIAVGDIWYYKLAYNLLLSYRLHSRSDIPFAIIADAENEYTRHFDKTIILSNPSKSYLDKITMLSIPPFDRNIFIDADCLAYNDLNKFWDYCPDSGVSCFGRSLSLDSTEGWFEFNDIGKYKDKVTFIPQMHGGVIFFHNDDKTKNIYTLSKIIAKQYGNFKFKYFSKPADEPIMALAMAVNGIHPVEIDLNGENKLFLFYPTAKKIKCNILKGLLSYKRSNGKWIDNVILLHWQNCNTQKPSYKIEVDSLHRKKHSYIQSTLIKAAYLYRKGVWKIKYLYCRLIEDV